MNNVQGQYRDLKDREVELLNKMAERGHEIAQVYQQVLNVDDQKLQVRYSQVGNFTIATLARFSTKPTTGVMPIQGEVTGASKRHPDDDPDEIIGQNIALSRALKGDFFQGNQSWRMKPQDAFEGYDDSSGDLSF